MEQENRFKYPRTFHFSWSKGMASDDKIIHDLSNFEGKEIIITEKMDGENNTMMRDSYYARSLDSNNHPSRNFVKGIWGNLKHDIPENFRICGENLYAQHSLRYEELKSYFMVFTIWNNETCLSWKETLEYCELLNLETVPVLYCGKFDLEMIKKFKIDSNKQEGYVIRLASEFTLDEFQTSVVKYVRKGHLQTDEHWMKSAIVQNGLLNNNF